MSQDACHAVAVLNGTDSCASGAKQQLIMLLQPWSTLKSEVACMRNSRGKPLYCSAMSFDQEPPRALGNLINQLTDQVAIICNLA